jgi:hypothetical protein
LHSSNHQNEGATFKHKTGEENEGEGERDRFDEEDEKEEVVVGEGKI